jgi:hypothetical protein
VNAKINRTITELQESRKRWNAKYDQAQSYANKGRQSMERLDTLNKKIEK